MLDSLPPGADDYDIGALVDEFVARLNERDKRLFELERAETERCTLTYGLHKHLDDYERCLIEEGIPGLGDAQ